MNNSPENTLSSDDSNRTSYYCPRCKCNFGIGVDCFCESVSGFNPAIPASSPAVVEKTLEETVDSIRKCMAVSECYYMFDRKVAKEIISQYVSSVTAQHQEEIKRKDEEIERYNFSLGLKAEQVMKIEAELTLQREEIERLKKEIVLAGDAAVEECLDHQGHINDGLVVKLELDLDRITLERDSLRSQLSEAQADAERLAESIRNNPVMRVNGNPIWVEEQTLVLSQHDTKKGSQ